MHTYRVYVTEKNEAEKHAGLRLEKLDEENIAYVCSFRSRMIIVFDIEEKKSEMCDEDNDFVFAFR